MKNIRILFTTIALLSFFNNIANAQDKASTTSTTSSKEYSIEPFHTTVTWISNHFGFSKPTGKFSDINGKIVFDEKKPENSSVDITIKTDSLYTGITKFDEHLKSKDFFDVKNFPTAKFVSKKITKTGKNKGTIEGDLTILGTTKPVVLKAVFNKSGVNPINQKQTIGFSATASIIRSEFGLKYALPGIEDKVDLIIEVEANN